MENLFLLKVEIFLFFLSLGFVFYYIWEKIYLQYFKIKNLVKPEKKNIEKRIKTKVKIDNKEGSYKKAWKKKKLKDKEKKELIGLLKRIKLNSWKGYFDTAKALIVEWLSLDKFNKDLNLELANIYEKEKKFSNAEFIYKDLIEVLEDDFEILKRLGFNLAMQNKFIDSIDIYKKAHDKKKSDNEIIDILSNLTYEVWNYKASLKYIKLCLKEKPRNVEKLKIKWVCLEYFWKTNEALENYKKILEIQPYNSEIIEKVKKLES